MHRKRNRRDFSHQHAALTSDSQKRLIAYTTAAGLGAFFAGQAVEAQVVESPAFSSYPQNLARGGGTGAYQTYFYLDIDGDGTPDFNLSVNNWRVDISGTPLSNPVLNPSSNAYLIPWTNGMTLDAVSGSTPTYRRFLATSIYQYQYYLFNNFHTSGALGFEFTSGIDNQPHFGYIQIKVNGETGVFGDFTATVDGIYYNQTPNAPITIGEVPVAVRITNIKPGPGESVTIDFTSSDAAPASAFSVETNTTLDGTVDWMPDSGAVITTNAPGVYQAVTTPSGESIQFFRINHTKS